MAAKIREKQLNKDFASCATIFNKLAKHLFRKKIKKEELVAFLALILERYEQPATVRVFNY